jgi:hypothetical protein
MLNCMFALRPFEPISDWMLHLNIGLFRSQQEAHWLFSQPYSIPSCACYNW